MLDGFAVSEAEGATLTALANGEGLLKITWVIDGVEYEKTVAITVTLPVEDYAQTLMFSATDGLFFNAQGEVVGVEDIFGAGAVLTDAVHATDSLTVENGTVLGLNTNGTAAVNTHIVLYTANKAYKIAVTAYTLVIDEAEDMNLFHHGGKGGWLGSPTYKIDDSEFTEADKFDGYYILVKNIDMTGSVFNTQINIKDAFKRLSGTLLKNYGLTGTFDGNGYAIENYLPVNDGGGLFAVINGGTVKNVKIGTPEGTTTTFNCSYLSSAIRDAKFEKLKAPSSSVKA